MDKTIAVQIPCNNAAIRAATRMIGQLFDDVIEPSGLRATQHTMLYAISILNGPTLREMSKVMVMDLSALGRSLKPLEREGLVKIAPDFSDRRVKRATITAAGTKQLQRSIKLWRLAQDRFEVALGSRRAAALRTTLELLSSDEFKSAFNRNAPASFPRDRHKAASADSV